MSVKGLLIGKLEEY
jgi:hypothetical protein